jgi:hypothetical protein
MSYIQQFFTSRDNNANAETFVGQEGRLWWDPVTNKIYYSDGATPGGVPITAGGGGGGGSLIFASGGNMGTVIQAVTSSDDLGLIIDSVTISYDLGTLIINGLIWPDQLKLPDYSVAELPIANPAGCLIFVSDAYGGSIPAFSDGTNWRRVDDRTVVS